MDFSAGALESELTNNSRGQSELMGQGILTNQYASIMRVIAEGISEVHNNWQLAVRVIGVNVNGGVSADTGPISGAIGVASVGTINGRIGGASGNILGRVPNNEIPRVTNALRTFIYSIGQGFEDAFNNFLETAVISNIQVNGGTCTCKITSGGPIPGTLISANGKLGTLEDNMTGIIPTEGVLFSTMINLIDSNLLGQGVMTKALKGSYEKISIGLGDYIEVWLRGTKLENLVCSGGVTNVGGPVVGAIGNAGEFI